MALMHRRYLLVVTALSEGATGLFLLLWPALFLELLLGMQEPPTETLFHARLAGNVLLAYGVACWFGRLDRWGHVLLLVVLVYDVGAALGLAFAALLLKLVGILLWPAVIAHTALAIWCILCFRDRRGARLSPQQSGPKGEGDRRS